MLFASAPRGRSFGAGASVAVEQVQQALKNYAQVSGKFTIDPGVVSGVMDGATAAALLAAVTELDFGDLTSALFAVARKAAVSGELPSLSNFVGQYSQQIVLTLQKAAAATSPSRGHGGPAMLTTEAGRAAFATMVQPPWYRTWKLWGPIGVIAAGATTYAIVRRL